MNKAEYWILRRAVKQYECLRDVAYECGLNQAEVAAAANRLFQNGDIKARVATHDEDFEETPNAYLTMSPGYLLTSTTKKERSQRGSILWLFRAELGRVRRDAPITDALVARRSLDSYS